MKSNLLWEQVLLELQEDIPKESFDSWITQLVFVEVDGAKVKLAAPSNFIRQWIVKNFNEKILNSIKKNFPNCLSFEIIIDNFENEHNKPEKEEVATSENKFSAPTKNKEIGLKFNPNYTFKNFVVGKPNEFAYNAAKRVAEDPSVIYNPLFIHGGVGLGKTHLLNAIGLEIAASKQKRNFLYVSAEQFMQLFISALQSKGILSFKETFRSCDGLMIDDFQFLSNKGSTQEEFFHTLNSLIDQKKQIIFTADKHPSELDGIESRISSRLNFGLVVAMNATTYELRIGILESKVKLIKAKVPHEVIEFLAHTLTSNVRELEGALNNIIARGDLLKHPITLELAHEVTKNLVKSQSVNINISDIQKIVAEHFSISLADLISDSRHKDIVSARQVSMYLAKKLTSLSLLDIGKKFGNKDHATVLYAVKKINEKISKDGDFSRRLNILNDIITKY